MSAESERRPGMFDEAPKIRRVSWPSKWLRGLFAVAATCILLSGLGPPAKADTFTVVLDGGDFSGSGADIGGDITVTFDDDTLNPNTVFMTIENNTTDTAGDGGDITSLLWNYTGDTANLTISCPECLVDPTSPGSSFVFDKTGGFGADGDGVYELLLTFAVNDLESGESVTFVITDGDGLLASDFNELSIEGGGQGTFTVAAHVQDVGEGGEFSGWLGGAVKVPEPGTLTLLASGLLLLGLLTRFRRRTYHRPESPISSLA